MKRFFHRLPRLCRIHQEKIRLEQSFDQVARRFAADAGTVVLLSGTRLDCARYDILAVDPVVSIHGRQNLFDISFFGHECNLSADPFELLTAIIQHFKMDHAQHLEPVSTGLFGYFAYDFKDCIESLPQTCLGPDLPDICLYVPSLVLSREIATGEMTLSIPVFDRGRPEKKVQEDIRNKKKSFTDRLCRDILEQSYAIDPSGFRSSFTKSEYMDAVDRVISFLTAGDIYQANLSQQFTAGFTGDPFSLFLDLFSRNPAPFFSFVNTRDHTVVSTSPERFIRQTSRYIETRPIKGTLARGKTADEDDRMAAMLLDSVKDDAELTMIVDLMRNDLSRVTKPGTVEVKEHKRLEKYTNVFHLVSVVTGELQDRVSAMDILKATFPGGSITGCPKIRAMEIIDALEPARRHVYTGAIGYISFHDTLDFSIAIRTATIYDNKIRFSVGGGIVSDSDPAKEYQETLDKGKTILEALSGTHTGRERRPGSKLPWIWYNGRLTDPDGSGVSLQAAGVQYGAGLFETIRVERGKALRLYEHVQRLNTSWKKLFDIKLPRISWENVIDMVIRENRLESSTAAVKILAMLDAENDIGGVSVALTARPYTHRLAKLNKPGLDLVTCPFPRQSFLADHKTLNYLFYDLAGKDAKKQGGDEAIVLNPDFTISETNTCSILIMDRQTVLVPDSGHVLPGVTATAVLTYLASQGYHVEKKRVPSKALSSFQGVILTNALMGAVPVLSIDKRAVPADDFRRMADLCRQINRMLVPGQNVRKIQQ